MKVKHLLIIVLPLMLIAGLRPKGYDPVNYIRWEKEEGLAFSSRSLAHSEEGIPLPESDFVLTMEIEPEYPVRPTLQILFLLFGDSPWDQLVIAQYDNLLIALNGWDYSDRWKTPKLYIPLENREGIIKIRIESGPEGTVAFLNDTLVRTNSELALNFPANREETRLVLGSDIMGNSNWTGSLYQLSLEEKQGKVYLDYDFRKTSGAPTLFIPERCPVLIKKFLQRPRYWQLRQEVFKLDMIVNLAGFIPLGALLFLFLRDKTKWAFIPAVLLSFLFSLFLESVQVWIPTRDSSLLDLFLNSAGGFLGTVAAVGWTRFTSKKLTFPPHSP